MAKHRYAPTTAEGPKVLLDHRGEPMMFERSPDNPPPTKGGYTQPPLVGETFGQWAGRDHVHLTLPGGGVMQFDLSRLCLADYRAMRQHYQLGASLNVLGFIMHQIDWEIECEDAEVKEVIEEDLRKNWTVLIRSISQAFWAGFSPIAINFENADGYVRIKDFRDLLPEECRIEWAEVEGWAPEGEAKPKLYRYNGFKQGGFWIPPENTLWYPLLMENGDYYGRKLLKPAFPAWYFSNLMHLFANRYFERFGEPLPVGRAPLGEQVDAGGGVMISAKQAMENTLVGIRNRSVAILPSERDPLTKEFDYQIEYLESQMRGADFERYLGRLDEEMSLAVFTPVLLFRTADVGSYNLGEAHLRIFQQMLNAVAGDLQVHFQKYLVDRMRVINFGQNAPAATWVFRRQGHGDIEQYKLLMSEIVRLGAAMPNLEELGKIVGLPFEKVQMLTQDNPDGQGGVIEGNTKATGTPKPKSNNSKLPDAVALVIAEAASRLERELVNGSTPTLGFKNRIAALLAADERLRGKMFNQEPLDRTFDQLNKWVAYEAEVCTPQEVAAAAERLLTEEIEALV